MNKTQQLLKDREELFDRKFKIMEQIGPEEVDGIFVLETDREKLKSFHATTISLLLTSLKEEIELNLTDLDNPDISYDKDVDITELPEGLIAEMIGMRKGWKAGLNRSIEILSLFEDKDVCDKHGRGDCMECFYTTSPCLPKL